MYKEIYEEIWDELEGAEHYAKKAVAHKADHPEIAKLYYDMANQEMAHSVMLGDEVARMMKTHPVSDTEKAVHDFVRDMQTAMASKVKHHLSQYK